MQTVHVELKHYSLMSLLARNLGQMVARVGVVGLSDMFSCKQCMKNASNESTDTTGIPETAEYRHNGHMTLQLAIVIHSDGTQGHGDGQR